MAVKLQAKIDDLQEKLENTQSNVNHLWDNQKEMAAVVTKGTTQPPADNNNKRSKIDMEKLGNYAYTSQDLATMEVLLFYTWIQPHS